MGVSSPTPIVFPFHGIPRSMNYRKETVWGWGRWQRRTSFLDRPEWPGEIRPDRYLQDFPRLLARGLGRSYGDPAMNTEGLLVLTTRLDRFLSWDEKEGILHAEAGADLDKILTFAVPRGFFLPVTPGTRFITLGGAVAFDVHGKNQHMDGNFGNHVLGFTLLLPSGERKWCSPEENPELYRATIAGMGLTGFLLDVKLKLQPIRSSLVKVRYKPFHRLEEARDIFLAEDKDFPFTVAWLDPGLERGVATLGRFASLEEAGGKPPLPIHGKPRLKVPFQTPALLLNRLSMALFYGLYYRLQSRKGTRLERYEKFFYPLDGIDDWNKLYGRRGFTQYQFVVPMEKGVEVIRRVKGILRKNGCRPCLAVLKLFGDDGRGILSFPRKGFTLAMDIPVTRRLPEALDEADQVLLEAGGRIYLAKDARMKPDVFKRMYPEFEEWLEIKNKVDPEGRLSSDLSRRLEIC